MAYLARACVVALAVARLGSHTVCGGRLAAVTVARLVVVRLGSHAALGGRGGRGGSAHMLCAQW